MIDFSRSIEEISMNAWPSLQTFLYDGWVIRLANGFTKRANSINPLYFSTENVEKKVKRCEQIFLAKELNPVFKISPMVFPANLDEFLVTEGYQDLDYTSVQVLEFKDLPEPVYSNIEISTYNMGQWLENCCRLNGNPGEHKSTLQSILRNIIPPKYGISLLLGDKVIACGMGVIQDEWMGLFDINVDKDFRKQGYGEQLLLNLLEIGKSNGVKRSYLQVRLNNSPALKLYSKLGFKEAYQYWYKVKEF